MFKRTASIVFILSIFALVWLGGCSNGEHLSVDTKNVDTDLKKDASEPSVLAYVDGTPITQGELDLAVERMFSSPMPDRDREQIEAHVLQSLISSRAISRLAEAELDSFELKKLDTRVQAYREELLVKEYLSEHVSPEPIPGSMVESYYQKHPEEFGGGTTKRFEMVQTHRALKDGERREVLKQLGALSSEADWKSWVKNHQSLPVSWRELNARVDVLDQPLKTLVAATSPGNTSPLHNDQRITIVRVNEMESHPAKPLLEVSAEIRRKLAPLKMKDAIKVISEDAKKQLKIELAADSLSQSFRAR